MGSKEQLEALKQVLGDTFWTAAVPNKAAADAQAARRMASGRPACTFENEGRWVVAWGVRA